VFPPYYYEDSKIQGFRASHWMSGSCTQDYGSVTIMPIAGKVIVDQEKRASAFYRDEEIMKGGKLKFIIGPQANKDWSSGATSLPPDLM